MRKFVKFSFKRFTVASFAHQENEPKDTAERIDDVLCNLKVRWDLV
jgi:hypothetical protein